MDQEGNKKGRNSWQSWKSVHGYALKQIVVNGSGRKLERNKFLVIEGGEVCMAVLWNKLWWMDQEGN